MANASEMAIDSVILRYYLNLKLTPLYIHLLPPEMENAAPQMISPRKAVTQLAYMSNTSMDKLLSLFADLAKRMKAYPILEKRMDNLSLKIAASHTKYVPTILNNAVPTLCC